MQNLDDMQLLRQYTATDSEEAFAALVSRHINLVYSAALRQVRNPHYAEEIVQAVFLILARKSRALRSGVILSGWLYHTARLASANFLRGEFRRHRREQEAYMQSTLNAPPPPAESWPQIAPLLDEAMAKLGEKDRNAVVMRYFEEKDMAAIAAALGSSESAAKMRLSRALEKLRGFFVQRGVPISSAGLAAVISQFSVQAAPAGLAASVTSGICGASAVAASTLSLTKGTLAMMAWTKVNIGIAAVAIAAVAYQWHETSAATRRAEALQEQLQHQTELYGQQQTSLQQLQQQNTALASQVQALAPAAAPASASPGQPGALSAAKPTVPPGGPSLAAAANWLKDPAMRKMMEGQQKALMKTEYSDLVKQLNLSPDQADKFYSLLIDQQQSNMDRGFRILAGGAAATDLAKAAKESQDANDAQLQALLGDDGLAQYRTYTETLGDRMLLNQMLPNFSDNPLTQDQQNQLLQVMKTARQNAAPVPGQAAPPDPASVTQSLDQQIEQQQQVNDEVLQQAASFLSAQQLQNLGTSQSNSLNMQKAGMAMVRSMLGSNNPASSGQ